MLPLVLLHLLAAGAAPVLSRALDRRVFYVLALAPAASFAWFVAQAPQVTGAGARTVTSTYDWVPELRLELAFQLNTLTWMMALLVTGIGALVLLYSAFYFREGDPAIGRFSAVLVAFAGSMLGLVIAGDLLLLYVFWELTTVTSYLLIGHNPERRANRRAAMNALIVTTFGGLAMLVGFVILGQQSGSYRIGEVVTSDLSGTAVTIAVGLVLLGAVSKSALVPFHFWLPGAMAAPTPVSAYLHAAAMVKAGIFLVALLAPAFAETTPWRPGLLALGVLTMVIGGLRALRQYDVKLLLAYGTVSQLGFLMVVVGVGTRAAALAGLALVLGHAFFKATLFMVVGVVDRSAHTRDLRELSGLRRRMPVVFGITVLAAASMAGLPPMLGFVAKEAALAAFVDLAHAGDVLGSWFGWVVLAGLVLGSVLTVAYTARFVHGVFADKPGVEPPADLLPVPAGFAAPAALLATGSLALGFLGHPLTELLSPYVGQFRPGPHDVPLALWHGPSAALALTVIAVAGGLALFWRRRRIASWRIDPSWLPDAERTYQAGMRGLDRLAVEITARTQRGSLPIYLGVIMVVLVAVPGSALLFNRDWGPVEWFDSPGQLIVAGLMAGAAVLTVRSRRRLRAVLLAGVTGYGMAMLFLIHGAPDLALTQVLVETVTLVIFVLVLRRLSPYFSNRPLNANRWWRVSLGVVVGLTVSGFALAAGGTRVGEPVSVHFPEAALEFGGGKNIVNVTLVDIRAWDTMGELSVLVVAATGVASLIFLIHGRPGRVHPQRRMPPRSEPISWLRAGRTLATARRSMIFEIVTRLIFHTMVVFSVYLIFSGHNAPGGGFAAGLVTGLALMIRYLAGGRHELDDAAPVDAGVVLGLGLVVATGSGLASLAFGGEVLQSAIVDLHVPVLGDLHLVTSLFFDIGVYLVVVGLMLDVLRSLGGGIDRDDEGDDPDDDTGDDRDDRTDEISDHVVVPTGDMR